jgi:dCTP deaminase
MIFSDTMLIEAIRTGLVSFDPPVDIGVQVQPASVDLRLGDTFRVYNYAQHALIDPSEDVDLDGISELVHQNGEPFILHPGAFVLGSTLEYVTLADNIVGRLEGRSSIGRLGVIVHSTAGYVDPGFHGNITLEISNIGKIPVALRAGMRVCQITLMETGPVARPYGPLRGSKYQGQREPTPSRLRKDVEFRARMESLMR